MDFCGLEKIHYFVKIIQYNGLQHIENSRLQPPKIHFHCWMGHENRLYVFNI